MDFTMPDTKMITSTAAQSSLSLKQILLPVSEDIARIDAILRQVAGVEYPLLKHGVEAIIAAGGKRLRPAILFLSAKFGRYDLDRLLPMAAGIELLHTATLVHDDTIDQALTRRGLPTLNSFVDEGTTVLIGDYLFAKSAVLSTMGGVQRATRIFAEALVAIVGGELEQKFSTHHLTNSLERYNKRIYAKTASLFAAAGEIGAVLAETSEEDVQRLRHYGRQVGMAFQIVDDMLDLQSTSQALGKPVGGDLRQGTVTLPMMLYLEKSNEKESEAVRRVIEGEDRSDALINKVIEAIVASDALDEAHTEALRYVEEAKDTVVGMPDIPARTALLEMADFVARRSF